MDIVIYSDVLNQHQAPLADELWMLTGGKFRFVELKYPSEQKGGTENYSQRKYLIKAWQNQDKYDEGMALCKNSKCCIFAGISSLPFEIERLHHDKLSFEMGERWLKRGIVSFASPRLLKWLLTYYIKNWSDKRLYKLCCSAFAASDHRKMRTFRNKCYKWGYFTTLTNEIPDGKKVETSDIGVSTLETGNTIMWCSRFLRWKHPELPIYLGKKLRENGYNFKINMYGNGPEYENCKNLIENLGLGSLINLKGAVDNKSVHDAMRKSSIFLFTSDKNEGWGAVANESMSERCALVASDAIGSIPYLIKNNVNGLVFVSPNTSSRIYNPDKRSLESLYKQVVKLLNSPHLCHSISIQARKDMESLWSPKHAAESLLKLVDGLLSGNDNPIKVGPGAKA